MNEYIYVGKEWAPEVGDVCEVFYDDNVWLDGEIAPLPEPFTTHPEGDYVVRIPDRIAEHSTGLWSIKKKYLRKKRPPQDMSEFTWDELINDLNKVPA